jgi:tRNA pseudouridine32 synthase/23S rRNA pseudouridine746 synthase
VATPRADSGGVLAGLPSLQVVYADAAVLVLNKPPGLLSVPGRGEDKQDCLWHRAQAHYPDALVVHRLDMATSGLLLMARGLPMQRLLSEAFASRAVQKQYVAVVDGQLHQPEWAVIDLPIAADWPNRPRRVIDPVHGKPSQTRWRTVSHNHRHSIDNSTATENCTRLVLEPVTGRTHQLRVHLQALGHPILGDALYGSPEVLARSPRLLLHATQLSLAHPASGAPLQFNSAADF